MDDKWFKAQQKRAGLTSFDLAAAIGRDRSVISRIINGGQPMTLEQARIFAEMMGVPLPEMVERAGLAGRPTAQMLSPGFAESDCAAWVPGPGIGEGTATRSIAAVLGADRPGVDIWRVRTRAMQMAGYMPDDFLLVDTHAAERVRPGDTVIAQIYNNATGTAATVLRRLDPPVLMCASADPEDAKAHVVDGVNVLVRGKVVASWRV
jgi:transcriptional regulator with XRE-family HTH domain